MKIAFVTVDASDDVRSWSGTLYFMSGALIEAGADLVRIQNLRGARSVTLRLRDIFRRRILRENYSTYRHPRRLRHYARQVEAQLERVRPDMILSTSTLPIAYLETTIPIVFWADATFAGLLDFYLNYRGVSRAGLREGHAAEAEALRRCAAALYSSQWAAQSAIDHYAVDPAKVHFVNYGANIPEQISEAEVASAIDRRPLDRCELLFVGAEWERKGGDIAIAVAVELNRRGLPTTLTLAGAAPPQREALPSCVKVLGYVDKSKPEGMLKIRNLFLDSNFLILPSRAECCAMVLAEAGASGLPALASDVGGISSAITSGRNGFLVPVGDRAEEVNRFCESVLTTLNTAGAYRQLAASSLEEYKDRLNWRASAARALEIMEKIPRPAQVR